MESDDLFTRLYVLFWYLIGYFILFNWFILWRKGAIIRQFFYRQIRHIIDKNRSPIRYKLFHYFNLACYIFCFIRFTRIVLILNANYKGHVDQEPDWDIFYYSFKSFSNSKDYLYLLTFIMFFLFCLFLEPEIYFTRVDTITWQKYNDLVLINYELYRKYHLELDQMTSVGQLVTFAGFEARLVKANRSTFGDTSLPHLPSLSVRLRMRTIEVVRLMERWSQLAIFMVCLALNLFFGYSYTLHYHRFSLTQIPFVIIELLLFSYCMIRLIVLALILLCCSNIGTLLYTGQIGEINDLLRHTLMNSRSLGSRVVVENLRYFLVEHTRVSTIVMQVNRELWSRVLLIALGVHVPSNVYLLHRIMGKSGSEYRTQAILSWFILLVQVIIVLASLVPLAHSSSIFHQATRFGPKVQVILPPKSIYLKIKFLILYERLHHEKQRYGITIGPTQAIITNRIIFEIFLIYIAFVLKVFEFFF